MQNCTDTLRDFHRIFYHYEQLDHISFEVEREALQNFYDAYSNYFTDEEYDLYDEVERLSYVAEKYAG